MRGRRQALRPFAAAVALLLLSLVQAGAELPKAGCDLSKGPCAKELEGGLLVLFDILPKPVAPMADLVFVVTLARSGKPLSGAEVIVDLTMPGMYMGKNSPVLVHAGGGRYEGKGILPRCMTGKKLWQAEVQVREPRGSRKVAFTFETS